MNQNTALERLLAIRARLAFGDAPHVQLIGTDENSWEWFTPANIARVKRNGIGTWVIWKNYYSTADQVDDATGAIPLADDGHLHYTDPETTQHGIDMLHAIGGRVLMYMGPRRWRDDGLSAMKAVDEILRFCKQHNLDGVYCDGAEFGDNEWETMRAFQRMKARGLYIVCHFSLQPNIGRNEMVYGQGDASGPQSDARVEYLMPFAEFCDMGLWGETNTDNLSTVEEADATLKRVSFIDTHPELLMMYKAAKDTVYDADPERRLPHVARLLYVEHIGLKNLWVPEEYGTWPAERAKYRADPEGYVRELAEGW